jgi:hypothetical protein
LTLAEIQEKARSALVPRICSEFVVVTMKAAEASRRRDAVSSIEIMGLFYRILIWSGQPAVAGGTKSGDAFRG